MLVILTVHLLVMGGLFAALRRRVWNTTPSNSFQRNLSAPLRIVNAIRFRPKWSENDCRTLKVYHWHFGPHWPATFVATTRKMGNNGTKNLWLFQCSHLNVNKSHRQVLPLTTPTASLRILYSRRYVSCVRKMDASGVDFLFGRNRRFKSRYSLKYWHEGLKTLFSDWSVASRVTIFIRVESLWVYISTYKANFNQIKTGILESFSLKNEWHHSKELDE